MEVPIIATGGKTDLQQGQVAGEEAAENWVGACDLPPRPRGGKGHARDGYLNCSAWLCKNVFQEVAQVALSSRSSN